MLVTPNPEAASDLLHKARHYQDERNERLEGVHVSDLIACPRRGWYRLHGYQEREPGVGTQLVMLIGHGIHHQLEHGNEETRVRLSILGEVVHGSVDYMDLDDGGKFLFPAEFKSTRFSSRTPPYIKTPYYLEQLATYCLAHKLLVGRLYVLYLSGAYGKERDPDLRAFDVEWTQDEMTAWEAELERRFLQITGGELPTASEHGKTECDYCQWNKKFHGPCSPNPDQYRGVFFTVPLDDGPVIFVE